MSENINLWDNLCYLVFSYGLFELGGKLSGYNEDLGALLGTIAIILFFYVSIKLYRFTIKVNSDQK